MVVISRMKDEGIVIGDDIVITVKAIEGDDVRLDIEHPSEIPVKKTVAGKILEQVAETSPQV